MRMPAAPKTSRTFGEGFEHDQVGVAGQEVEGGAAAEFSVGLVDDDQGIGFLQQGFQIRIGYDAAGGVVWGAEDNRMRLFPMDCLADSREVEGVVGHGVHRHDPAAEDAGIEAVEREAGRWNHDRDARAGADGEDELDQRVGAVADNQAFRGPADVPGKRLDQVGGHRLEVPRPGALSHGFEDLCFEFIGNVEGAFVLVEFYRTVVGFEVVAVDRPDFGLDSLERGRFQGGVLAIMELATAVAPGWRWRGHRDLRLRPGG